MFCSNLSARAVAATSESLVISCSPQHWLDTSNRSDDVPGDYIPNRGAMIGCAPSQIDQFLFGEHYSYGLSSNGSLGWKGGMPSEARMRLVI